MFTPLQAEAGDHNVTTDHCSMNKKIVKKQDFFHTEANFRLYSGAECNPLNKTPLFLKPLLSHIYTVNMFESNPKNSCSGKN